MSMPWYSGLYYSFSSSGEYRFSRLADTLHPVHRRCAARVESFANSRKRYLLAFNQSLPINADWFDRTTDYLFKVMLLPFLSAHARSRLC
jgi:hypothetical protein